MSTDPLIEVKVENDHGEKDESDKTVAEVQSGEEDKRDKKIDEAIKLYQSSNLLLSYIRRLCLPLWSYILKLCLLLWSYICRLCCNCWSYIRRLCCNCRCCNCCKREIIDDGVVIRGNFLLQLWSYIRRLCCNCWSYIRRLCCNCWSYIRRLCCNCRYCNCCKREIIDQTDFAYEKNVLEGVVIRGNFLLQQMSKNPSLLHALILVDSYVNELNELEKGGKGSQLKLVEMFYGVLESEVCPPKKDKLQKFVAEFQKLSDVKYEYLPNPPVRNRVESIRILEHASNDQHALLEWVCNSLSHDLSCEEDIHDFGKASTEPSFQLLTEEHGWLKLGVWLKRLTKAHGAKESSFHDNINEETLQKKLHEHVVLHYVNRMALLQGIMSENSTTMLKLSAQASAIVMSGAIGLMKLGSSYGTGATCGTHLSG